MPYIFTKSDWLFESLVIVWGTAAFAIFCVLGFFFPATKVAARCDANAPKFPLIQCKQQTAELLFAYTPGDQLSLFWWTRFPVC